MSPIFQGQLEFEDEGSSGSKPKASSDGVISIIARLLGVPATGLAKGMTELVTDQFTRAFSPAKASETRDSLCKAIYSAVFDWLVHTCNVAMKMADATVETDFIGMLDIFGFEIFKKNGFEQLCINFANEKLQQMFNKHTFLLEEETYAREGVPFEHVAFYDSQPMLTFLGLPAKGKPKGGLFGILDEQTAVQSTDEKVRLHYIYMIRLLCFLCSCVLISLLSFPFFHFSVSPQPTRRKVPEPTQVEVREGREEGGDRALLGPRQGARRLSNLALRRRRHLLRQRLYSKER